MKDQAIVCRSRKHLQFGPFVPRNCNKNQSSKDPTLWAPWLAGFASSAGCVADPAGGGGGGVGCSLRL